MEENKGEIREKYNRSFSFQKQKKTDENEI